MDVCLLAFLFLEWNRNRLVKIERSRKEKGKLFRIHTHGMKLLLHTEAIIEAKEILKYELVA